MCLHRYQIFQLRIALYTFYVFIYLKYWIIWYIITVYLILNLILKFNQNQKRYKKNDNLSLHASIYS